MHWLITIFVLLATLLIEAHGEPPSNSEVQPFLDWYWARPLAPQGDTPLEPSACQPCHPQQFADWEKSRHARAMGPGVIGQILDMTDYQNCLDCHAPLSEQADSLDAFVSKNDHNSLYKKGLICSACHLRANQWFGPPRRADLPPLKSKLPHNGWNSHKAFEDSRFCAACHQFPADGYAVNGKLLENTYEEWKVSPAAQKGQTCQSCHMPNRRHLWRGIHDPASVRSGVDIQTSPVEVADGFVRAKLSMTNTGTGHYFPTYITPKIVMQAYQENKEGKQIKDSLQQTIVERHLSLDLTTEYFDTRLAPGQTAILNYQAPLKAQTTTLVLIIKVEPDAFYTRLYQALLEEGFTDEGTALIQQALAESIASIFTLYQVRYPIQAKKPSE
jgi:nitrate/TMAO reductase-like tetraheme cytochrome c subunit